MIDQNLNKEASDQINEHLSKNLSFLMNKNKISESDLARALNLPYNTIHRLVSGFTTDPRISTLKSIAVYFKVSLDNLCQPLEFNKNPRYAPPQKIEFNEALLHYILKQSHHLYPVSSGSNKEYADFVIGLFKEVSAIDTSEFNLIKIIDLALNSLSSYEEQRTKQSHAL